MIRAVICLALLGIDVLYAQEAQFDVATVRRSAPSSGVPWGRLVFPAERVSISNMSLKTIIASAYGLSETQIEGPGWIGSERFDVEGKVLGGDPSVTVRKEMLRRLLRERFRLSVRQEQRTVKTSVLVLDGSGKLPRAEPDPNAPSFGMKMLPSGEMERTITGDMEALIIDLTDSLRMERPLVNDTKLHGRYHLSLGVVPRMQLGETAFDWEEWYNEKAMNVRKALKEQGLKVVQARAPVTFLVIDRVERPDPREN